MGTHDWRWAEDGTLEVVGVRNLGRLTLEVAWAPIASASPVF